MGKGKLKKFADMAAYPNVIEHPYSVIDDVEFPLQGNWKRDFFKNNNPIVLELGCGRGEYTVALARRFPDKNFIGVDIKGARMWTGATDAMESGLTNVGFLRTNIEIIDRLFAAGEVSEIWLTFPDPQMKKYTKRLTSSLFLARYRNILADDAVVHLKTDSNFMFTYTRYITEVNALPCSNVILCRLSQPSNIYAEMLSSLLFCAKVKEVSLEQPSNAPCAIVDIFAGMRIEVRPQYANA